MKGGSAAAMQPGRAHVSMCTKTLSTSRRAPLQRGLLAFVHLLLGAPTMGAPVLQSWDTSNLYVTTTTPAPLTTLAFRLSGARPCPDNCDDIPGYTDAHGYWCSEWAGFDCAHAEGVYMYTAEQESDLLLNCPATCGVCTGCQPVTASSLSTSSSSSSSMQIILSSSTLVSTYSVSSTSFVEYIIVEHILVEHILVEYILVEC